MVQKIFKVKKAGQSLAVRPGGVDGVDGAWERS